MVDNKKVLREIRGWTFSLLGALVIVSVVNSKVLAKVQVKQSSMENRLYDGQHLIVDELSYNFSNPKRGDVIIFLEGEEKVTIIEDTMNSVNLIRGKSKDSRVFGLINYNQVEGNVVFRVYPFNEMENIE